MPFEIFFLIIEAPSTILIAACLLLFYLHLLKINFAPNSGNPFSEFLIPLSNWLITPIGKIISFGGQIDVRSLLASYLLALFSLLELVLSGYKLAY